MTSDEAVELAIHRALRAEVPPFVRAVVIDDLSADVVALSVFHYGPASALSDFGEVVASELDQCLPSALAKAPRLTCELLPAETFESFPGRLIVHDNPWAAV